MTISTTAVKTFGAGNGATTDFTFSFATPAASNIVVTYVTAAGVETDVTSICAIVLNAVPAGGLWALGGTVTYNPSGVPIATGTYLCIARVLTEDQQTQFENQDSVYNAVTEMTFDTVVMLVQQLQEAITRCIQIPKVDQSGLSVTLPFNTARESQTLVTDGSGNVTTVSVTSTIISAAMLPVVQAITLAAARTAMGVISDPTTTEGDMIYRHTGALARLAIGTTGKVISSDGTDPLWSAITTLLDNSFSSTQGAVLYRDAAAWAALAPGTSGQFLETLGAGANPAWAFPTSSGAPVIPNGRLTLVSATPVMTTTQSAKTSVFYTPYTGGYVPIYNGSMFVNNALSELTLALDSNAGHTGYQQSGKLFDFFVFLNSNVVTLCTGPAWSSTTARGTGAGSTELQLLNGIWTNKNTLVAKIDATSSTVNVTANQATYLGTMLASADGTTQFVFGTSGAGGTAGSFNLWNAYNRVSISAMVQDSTTSWNYTTATWRSADNSTGNRVSYIYGINEDGVSAAYSSSLTDSFASGTWDASNAAAVGIGIDSTSSPSGAQASLSNASPGGNIVGNLTALYRGYPGLGSHFIQALENGGGTSVMVHTATWYGVKDQGKMALCVDLRM